MKSMVIALLALPQLLICGGPMPFAILGGKDGTTAYAAFVDFNTQAARSSFTNLPTVAGSVINGVAINNLGQAIVGGQIMEPTGPSYAAYINLNANSAEFPISNLLGAPSYINSPAINDLNQTIVGGSPLPGGSRAAYAAFVNFNTNTAGAAITNVPTPDTNTLTNDVAINNAETSMIAGGDHNFPYAAYVNPATNAAGSTVMNLPGSGFTLHSCIINQSGQTLVGGRDVPNGTAYAAFVDPNTNTALPNLLDPSIGVFRILKGALNDYGQGLLGGYTNANAAYAAFVDPITHAVSAPISNIPTAMGSQIWGAAINNFGQGLIGGTNGTSANAQCVFLVHCR